MMFELDTLTTEEGVLQAFQARPSLASIPIKSVRISRDSLTSVSKGVCYVESNNVADAIRLLAILNRESFEIDGRKG
jgi:RNA-binding protein 5/10